MGRIQNFEFGHSVLTYGTWNVQGLTDLKLFELILSMKRYSIDILCLQETRSVKASVYTEQGHLVITSGTDDGARCWSGVANGESSLIVRYLTDWPMYDCVCLEAFLD